MNKGRYLPILDRRKIGEYIMTGLLAVLVLATVLFPIRDLDQITTLGNEIEYWGGAMSILGQDWSSYMDGQAMVSYGYSLILVPICMLFQNASFAYKAAIILNGCIWVFAYLLSVKVGKYILKEVNHYVIIIGCFLIYLLPIYGESRTTVTPQAVMILLIWICVGIIYKMQENVSSKYLILLGVCIVGLCWLDISMIAVFAGTGIYLYFYVKNVHLEEEQFLKWILAVLIGVCVGYFIEQIILYNIFDAADIRYNGSLHAIFDKIITNWTNEGIVGFLFAIVGKMYSVSVNTYGLILPALYLAVKTLRKYKDEKTIKLCPLAYAFIVFGAMFLFHVLCWMGVSASSCRETLMVGMIPVVIGPMLLLTTKQMTESSKWMEESIGYVAVTIGTALIISYIFKNITTIAVDSSFGLLNYAYQSTETLQGMLYLGAVVALIVFLSLYMLIKVETKWRKINWIASVGGCFILSCVSLFYMNENNDYVTERQSAYSKYQQVADVLNSIEGEIYCKQEDASLKNNLPILQMLTNKSNILIVTEDKFDEEIAADTYISSGPYSDWEEEFGDYKMNCQIKNVVVWSQEGSQAEENIEEFLTTKEYKATKTDGGRSSFYGKDITLTKGTYVARFYLKPKNLKEKEEAVVLKVEANDETLQAKNFSAEEMEAGKDCIVELEFSSDEPLEDVIFRVIKAKTVKLNVEKVTYQKKNSEYTYGINNSDDMEEILAVKAQLDSKVGEDGSVIYYEEGSETGDQDYVICDAKLSLCYDLLYTHMILYKNDAYMLLSPFDSKYCDAMKEEQGFLGSEGATIDFRTFLEIGEEGEYDLADSFKLESGDYDITLKLKLIANDNKEDCIGIYRLRNGENWIAGKKIWLNKFDKGNIYEITISHQLYKDVNNFHYELDLKEGVEIEVLEATIKMNAAKYAIGSETNLSDFAKIITRTDENARVSFWTEEEFKRKETHSLEHLESILPDCDVDFALYDELINEQGDKFIITKGYYWSFFKLASKYTMIAQEGKYLLWARSDGRYIIDAMKHGATMLSQGNKIAAEVLAEVQGKEFDGTVSNLPNGTYRFYIDMVLTDIVEGDVIEVGLIRDKTEAEMEEERANYEAQGYTEDQVEKMLETTYYTNTQEYELDDFSDGKKVVVFQMKCDGSYKKLKPICYSWRGSTCNALVTWVELE